METCDRILECSLLLSSEQGEPNVSTPEIVNELGISLGSLYYHPHGEEPLVMALPERFQVELVPLLDLPEGVRLGTEDYWLFLHLIVECLTHYRFLFQDLSNLTGRLPRLTRGIRTRPGTPKWTLATLLVRPKTDRQLRNDAPALGQLAEQITLTLLFSLDYQRVLGNKGEVRTVVYQIMMLVASHLYSEAQRPTESLAQCYLGPERKMPGECWACASPPGLSPGCSASPERSLPEHWQSV